MGSPLQAIDQNIISSVQKLVTCGNKVTSIPSHYAYFKNPSDSTALPGDDIPVIDYSLLISGDHDQQTKTVSELGKACQDWGFFMVKNHGISEKLYEAMFEKCEEFNSMSDDEKQEFKMKKDVMDRIKYGSSNNLSSTQVRFWRDYLKLFLHPDFNSPHKPAGFSETLLEVSKKQREVMKNLLRGVSKSLEVEESYLYNMADMDRGMDFFAANIYPPCPQPELAVGLSPHTDFGLLIMLASNGVGGLQIQRNGTWYSVDVRPNHLMVNLGDHMEILTNGKYKSVVHRAMVNSKTTRISSATVYGPEVNKFVVPAPKFVDDNNPPVYRGMKYGDYFIADQTSTTKGVTSLDLVRI
ncbi:Fe2OG dioxygenase domain-containing protein [Heracleum sosnowskyi]|uniref:Fe2OG dioxygenase domain-containing protein n=1 Tax=Heracleum sosnowskyi TaxID=360622 RepID=A0AAD8II43_9APIA|nr:Fe2OG dioxygenase domain-containing protein [Heracleum sosnowskyi]